MKYFNTLPTILYTGIDGVQRVATNIVTRSNIVNSLQNNPLLYYTYDVQDSDTPEIVASKYYNDPYKYWIIFYINNMFDARWDWPLNNANFDAYINDKYSAQAAANNQTVTAYTQSTISEYQLTITTTDFSTQNTTVDVYTIDANTYANTVSTSVTYPVGNSYVSVVKTPSEFSIYDSEVQANEAKRTIKLVNVQYVGAVEQQFIQLMSQ